MTGSFNKFFQFKSRLAGLACDARWYLGQDRAYIKNAKGGRILAYHGICTGDHLRFNTLFVTQRNFERQLKLYKKYFSIISLDDFYQQKISKEKFTICLTFDDGFSNNYEYVLPLLEQYQVPATFFVTGIRGAGYDILWNDFLNIAGRYGPDHFIFNSEIFYKNSENKYVSSSTEKNLLDILRHGQFEEKAELIKTLGPLHHQVEKEYWMQMTGEQIRRLSRNKWVTIGSHSYYHNDLAKISTESVENDMALSKEFLENITGKEVSSFAFPYGSYTSEVVELALKAGYKKLLATEFLFPCDKNDTSLKERLTVNPFISNINQLYANVRGNYN